MFEAIRSAKENEQADVVLLIADNPDAQRMVVAWKNVPRKHKKTTETLNSLEEAWEKTDYDIEEWASISKVHSGLARDIAKMVIANKIIYPDGTTNQFVQKYLNAIVISKISKVSSKK